MFYPRREGKTPFDIGVSEGRLVPAPRRLPRQPCSGMGTFQADGPYRDRTYHQMTNVWVYKYV